MARQRQDVLTPKSEAFVTEYLANNQNGTQAALKAFDIKDNNINTAAVMAHEYLRKPNVVRALERAGINDDRLAKVAEEGLRATRPVIRGDKVYTVEDYAVRHKYLDTIHKLKGDYAPEKIETDNRIEHIVRIEEDRELLDIKEGELMEQQETITSLVDEATDNA